MKLTRIKATGLSLLEVRAKYPDCFYKKQWWYDNEPFASEKPEAGEYEFDFTSKYLGNDYGEHAAALKRENMELPHPAVLAEALCVHFKETGERLMSDWYSRTRAFDSDGDRVLVGTFDAGGLSVSHCWDGDRDSYLGVFGVRKVDTRTLETLGSVESLPEILEVNGVKYKRVDNSLVKQKGVV